MDKPRPPRRGYPPDYPEPTQYDQPSYPQISGGTVNTVTSRIFEAYKINPIMIAMILLLLSIIGALGYYMMRNDDRIYGYIALRDTRERDLNDRLIEMALKCRDQPTDKSAYPQPKFPELSTGGKSFEDPPSPPRRDAR
jgi:hypothetical protein